MYTDLILHVDTAAHTLDAAVLGVSATLFRMEDTTTPLEHWYYPVQLNGQGRHIDMEVLDEWRSDDAVYPVMISGNPAPLESVLDRLEEMVESAQLNAGESLRVWGACDTDLALLRSCFEQDDRSTPWNFYQTFDAETLLRITDVNAVEGETPEDFLERRIAALRVAITTPTMRKTA